MIVSIFRHGEAGHAARDRERTLTAAGERDIQAAGEALFAACKRRDSVPMPQQIAVSPWVRTAQTAAILAQCWPGIALLESPDLQPGATVANVDNLVGDVAQQGCAHIVLVSHQPLVSHIHSHYLDDAGRVPGMAPGAFTTFSLDTVAPLCGELLFFSTPPVYVVQT